MALNLVPLQLAPVAALTNSAAMVYAAPSSGNSGIVVKKAVVTNITGTAANFNIWVVPSGGSPANGNLICAAIQVPGNTTYIVNELNGWVMQPGDMLWADASALTTMNFGASGFGF